MKYILEIMPSLLDGLKMTIGIFILTLVGSLPLGGIIGLGLTIKPKNIVQKLLSALLNFYIWLMRGTPLLLQLLFVFYGLPIVGIVFPRFEAALVAFILNYAAYFAEIFRGGIQSIDPGQYEAAKVLRLSYSQTIMKVILPQVNKIVMPSIGNEVINLVKDSSLVYVIGLGDLLRAGNVASTHDVSLIPLVLVGVLYLILTAILTYGLKRIEKHYSYYR